MDRPGVDPQSLRRSLKFIQRVNSLLGYTRATIWHLEQYSQSWKPGEVIRIVDFATGSADIPRAILRWADRRKFHVRIVGIDLHPITARIAEESSDDRRLTIVRADALATPFADASFDYALTAMFLHHLDDADAVRVLQEMNRVCRRGIIAADLLRNGRAYRWVSLFTMFSSRIIRHDARVSVAQAFSPDEVLAIRDAAGVGYARYHRHFGHRFALAGEKSP
ncbi:hypothetical protein BH09PLA1_BH09PLA1_07290 [soil metagenome]